MGRAGRNSNSPGTMRSIERSDERIVAAVRNASIYKKEGEVRARQVSAGERVDTVLEDGTRETTRVAEEGDWEVQNPSGERYLVPNDKFQMKYEPSSKDGVFLAKGLVRATTNPLGTAVSMETWGSIQYGDKDCIFACACDAQGNLLGEPYIVDRDAFQETYSLSEEHLFDLVEDRAEWDRRAEEGTLHPDGKISAMPISKEKYSEVREDARRARRGQKPKHAKPPKPGSRPPWAR